MKKTLASFGNSRFSQYGEDGIVAKILECIGPRSRVCVEIGAWDGFHLSNVANLWTNGWKAVLIECDERKFETLRKNVAGHDCVCVKEMVGTGKDNSIEAILARAGVREVVDVLCIDIDGDDYYLFESMRSIRPRVVICEYNPTIPADIDLYGAPGNYFGCSVASLCRLAGPMGYRLVALTDTNAFFVVEEDAAKLQEFEMDLSRIRVDTHLVHLVTSYAGDYVLSRSPTFALGFPYKGGLVGNHQRVNFRPGLLRALRPLKRVFRRLTRGG